MLRPPGGEKCRRGRRILGPRQMVHTVSPEKPEDGPVRRSLVTGNYSRGGFRSSSLGAFRELRITPTRRIVIAPRNHRHEWVKRILQGGPFVWEIA